MDFRKLMFITAAITVTYGNDDNKNKRRAIEEEIEMLERENKRLKDELEANEETIKANEKTIKANEETIKANEETIKCITQLKEFGIFTMEENSTIAFKRAYFMINVTNHHFLRELNECFYAYITHLYGAGELFIKNIENPVNWCYKFELNGEGYEYLSDEERRAECEKNDDVSVIYKNAFLYCSFPYDKVVKYNSHKTSQVIHNYLCYVGSTLTDLIHKSNTLNPVDFCKAQVVQYPPKPELLETELCSTLNSQSNIDDEGISIYDYILQNHNP